MRYEIGHKVCKQKDHNLIYLMDHNNVWWCTECKTICCGNRRRILPCTYEWYKKWMLKLGILYHSEEEIKKWANNFN